MSRLDGPLPEPLHRLEHAIDRVVLRLKDRFGLADPLRLIPFRSHGTPDVLHLRGRLLERGRMADPADAGTVRSLLNSLHRLQSDEVPGATVRARFGGRTWETETDREGYWAFRLEPGRPVGAGWHDVEVEVTATPVREPGARAVGRVLVPDADAEFGVVSDLDDTVIRTGATDLLTELRTVILGNARTRTAFAGADELYRALERGPDGRGRNPIFYVSRCGWNLYDLVEDVLELHGIPPGPCFLQDLAYVERPSPAVGREQSKRDRIRMLLDTYPELPLVLVGDSGQDDPEVYRDAVRERPARIRAVYVRDVSDPERDAEVDRVRDEVEALGVPFVRAAETSRLADAAAADGLITADAAERVRRAGREEADGSR